MDYPYLNQTGFDATNCSGLAGMDPGLSSCNIPGTYGDLSRCTGQVSMPGQGVAAAAAAGYGAYNSVRGPFSTASPSCLPSSSCSMMPRPGDHRQPPMFPSGKTVTDLSGRNGLL